MPCNNNNNSESNSNKQLHNLRKLKYRLSRSNLEKKLYTVYYTILFLI